jgi:hypothetical protein
LRRFSDKDLILTDAVGLHLMRVWKIHTCWSTDFHPGLTGVSLMLDRSKDNRGYGLDEILFQPRKACSTASSSKGNGEAMSS